jgi:hypothetical protein
MHGHGRPTIDLEISSCCAYPLNTYEVYGTRGGLAGTTDHLDWKYFNPEEASEQHLTREPLPGRAYCTELLKWHTGIWDTPAELSGSGALFDVMAMSLYANLYAALKHGTSLDVTPEHVRQQIAVMEECHRQNPLSQIGD